MDGWSFVSEYATFIISNAVSFFVSNSSSQKFSNSTLLGLNIKQFVISFRTSLGILKNDCNKIAI